MDQIYGHSAALLQLQATHSLKVICQFPQHNYYYEMGKQELEVSCIDHPLSKISVNFLYPLGADPYLGAQMLQGTDVRWKPIHS
jgi:hypothetical protein